MIGTAPHCSPERQQVSVYRMRRSGRQLGHERGGELEEQP